MKLTLLVGPPGSGKSTLAKKYESEGFVRVNQDSQGRNECRYVFRNAVAEKKDIVVDRMNFDKNQRREWLQEAKFNGYETEIMVLHENWQTCFDRIMKRTDHETIKDEKGARSALQTFFTKYERPLVDEADKVTFIYPEGPKPHAIICDLDGTLADCEHRRHFVRPDILPEPPAKFKKDWVSFFKGMEFDKVKEETKEVLRLFANDGNKIVYCSGRPDDYKKLTMEWLKKNALHEFYDYDRMIPADLYMRHRHDSRQDNIVKEIILDFEILSRYTPFLILDDRQQVVDMWRNRGFVCFQVAPGDF